MQQIDELSCSLFAVRPLTARFLSYDAENTAGIDPGSKPLKEDVFLFFVETWRMGNVEFKLYPRFKLVDVLSAGPAAACSPEQKFGFWDADCQSPRNQF